MGRTTITYQRTVSFSMEQQQLILGSLLGDASLSKPPSGVNFHWSIYHAAKQKEFLVWKHRCLQPHSSRIQECAYLDKRDNQIRAGARFHLPSLPWFTDLRHLLYPVDKKHISQQFLSLIHHPIALAALIGDDGHWDKAGIQIASKQFDEQENMLLSNWLNKTFSINAAPKYDSRYWHIRIPALEVSKVQKLCFPHLPSSLWYKLGGTNYRTHLVEKVTKECPICRIIFEHYSSEPRAFCSRECADKGKRNPWFERQRRYGSSGSERNAWDERRRKYGPSGARAKALSQMIPFRP